VNDSIDWKYLLGGILDEFGCQTGTIHRTGVDGVTLHLVCQIGVPDALLDRISAVPFGKGIAGAAAERQEPVTLCNLQQDLGGVAKPDARQTGVSGSLAVPVFAGENDHVLGTLGIGMTRPHDFSDEEIRRLQDHARRIAELFQNNAGCDD
jgi:L-methionine (R)-S-oxide reductase